MEVLGFSRVFRLRVFMSIPFWLLPALLSMSLFGGAVFLPKLAMRSLPPLQLIVYHAFFFFLSSLVVLGFYGFHLEFDPRGILLAVAVGVFATLGQIFYYVSLRHGPVAPVVVISTLYPLVVTALAVMFLKEIPTPQQWLGIVTGIGAIILAAAENRT